MQTVIVWVIVTSLLIFSAIWYNFAIQYYYIVHLKMQEPSSKTHDKYFALVYYSTTILNELNFGLLIGMSAIVLKFSRVRTRRIILSRAKNENRDRRANSDNFLLQS